MRTFLGVLLLALSAPSFAAYSTSFEAPEFVPGNVYGQNGWGHTPNSPTGGFIVPAPAGSPPALGAQSLELRYRDDIYVGVTNHLSSATITPPAGETGSVIEGVPVADPQSHFQATLWFRTPDVPLTPTRTDRRIAELNPATKGPDFDDPANRYAQVRLFNDLNGQVRVEIAWYPTLVDPITVQTVGYLEWGSWYRFDYLIHFVDGLNGNAANDRFSLFVYDTAGALVGSACGSTWEAGYKTGDFGGGTAARAVNSFDLWGLVANDNQLIGHVDQFSMNAFTQAQTPLTASIDGANNVCFGATTTLTANTAGGDGAITSYIWRDDSNTVVGTSPSFDAGPGTYTLTVTDSLCTTATSSPFVVTESAALAVTITGQGSVCCQQSTPLQANVTGGSGSITSYEWRDAGNAVVGTGSTYDAYPGTYTVRVTDASCGTATSQPFVVAQAAAPAAVPTVSELGLIGFMVLLAAAALLRIR
jgi:hypothetical protein